MLQQFINSTMAYFKSIEPMSVYIQKIPTGVKYPCMLVNKCDIKNTPINGYMFMNNITLFIRVFGNDELETKGKAYNIVQTISENLGKIPVLNEDGSESNRFIRVESIEAIDITVDQNEVYCTEINFSFDTAHKVNYQEFEKLAKFYQRTETR